MIELGSKVKDMVSGFTGIAVARYEFMYGCTRYSVQPLATAKKPGKLEKSETFDEPQLEVLETPTKEVAKSKQSVKDPGGPCPYTPDSKDP
jgi:hypothetical protein